MKKPIVISISVNKGGCGKSTISSNLAYALAEMGEKVLIIDTDSQMNATASYGLDSCDKNFYKAFMGEEPLINHIISTNYENIDFVVGDSALASVEIQMSTMQWRERRMELILESVIEEGYYDFIIVDTSSNIGMLNTSILHASDYVLIPIDPSSFSIDGMQSFIHHFENVRNNSLKHYNKNIEILGVVMNRFTLIENLSKDVYEIVKSVFKEFLLDTILHKDTNIGNAQLQSLPVGDYNKKTRATEDYKKLAREVIKIVKK